jgi:signal transduction histidine kinase
MEDFVKGTAGKASRDYLDKMIRAARRMQTLIEDLLALARVTTKGRPFKAVPLSELLEEVLGDLESRIRETGGKVSADPLPILEGDAVQLRQLFQNLLGNALKFHRKGIPPEVKVGAEILDEGPDPSGKRVRLTFADNGIGFDNKYSGQIFKAFERLHGQEEYAGTGIGLAICKRVVERHGGTITAEGFPGKGSLFAVTLPMSHPTID